MIPCPRIYACPGFRHKGDRPRACTPSAALPKAGSPGRSRPLSRPELRTLDDPGRSTSSQQPGEGFLSLTLANLRVSSLERSCTGGTLGLLTAATSRLTTKREG